MITWQMNELKCELRFSWAIARETSTVKTNFIVHCQLDSVEGLGEIAPLTRFNESLERIREDFDYFLHALSTQSISSVEGLYRLLREQERVFCRSFCFGIEAAYLDLMSKISEKSLSELIGLRGLSRVSTLYSLPIMPHGDFPDFLTEHRSSRFSELKLKVKGDKNCRKNLMTLLETFPTKKIAVDGNECFHSVQEVVDFFEGVDPARLLFLEQPFHASKSFLGRSLKGELPVLLVADESLSDQQISDDYALDFHMLNLKLMKTGSFLVARRQIQQARSLGLKLMLGCMIETSLNIRYAMSLAGEFDYLDLDGFLLLKKDPFLLVTENNGQLYCSDTH